MKSFKLFTEDFQDAKQKSITFLNQITTSSRFGVAPDDNVRHFLKNSLRKIHGGMMTSSFPLYRGLNLNHLDSSAKDALRSLKVGQMIPREYERPNTGQILIHTTTDPVVAEKYAGDGCCIVFEMLTPAYSMITDTANLREVFLENDFTPDDWNYFDNESEVLVDLDALFSSKILKVSYE